MYIGGTLRLFLLTFSHAIYFLHTFILEYFLCGHQVELLSQILFCRGERNYKAEEEVHLSPLPPPQKKSFPPPQI